MAETMVRDQIERVGKTLPVALAALYVSGFIIVAFRLAGYGASSLDVFRIQYLAAGFWFCLAGAAFFTFAASFRPLAEHLIFREPLDIFRLGFRTQIQRRELVATVAGDCVLLVFLAGMLYVFRTLDLRFRPESVTPWTRLVLLSLSFAAVDVLRQVWLYTKARQQETPAWSVAPYLSMLYLATSVGIALQIFALTLYPKLPFSIGGGAARQVIFWLGTPSASTKTLLERDGDSGYTVPYELLLENETSFVVISPKDNQRSIVFDRRAVEGMIVLGKRPQSAPANFQRNVFEPTTNKYEVVERSQKEVPDFMSKGTHTEVDYVLLGAGHKFYAACDTTALDKLDPAATCAFRVLRSYECIQPTDNEPKKAMSDLQCKDDGGHPVYLYVNKKE